MTLIVSEADVKKLLPMDSCIDLMGEALGMLARGEAVLPLRQVLRIPGGRNAFASMPAILGPAIGAKIITVFHDNDSTPWDSHIGVVLYFDNTVGRLLAILDASSITAIRTAAVSGLATRLLARPGVTRLAVLGTGVQAMTHVEAMCCVRPISHIRVWSRSPDNRRMFAEAVSERFGISCNASETAEEAVLEADIICTCTSSRTPVLEGHWVAPGTHINAVGASVPTARELASGVVVRSRLYLDRRESAMNEAGEFLIPREEGVIGDSHIVGEIGDVVLGRTAARGGDSEVTLFKSLGLAIEDVACARFIFERARDQGAGTWIEIGGRRAQAT